MEHIQKLRKLILTLGILAGMGMTVYAAGGGTEVTQANVICQQYSYMDAGMYSSGGMYDTPPADITNIELADAQAFGAAVNCPTTYWVVVYAKDGDNLKWTSNGKTGEQTSTPESANGRVFSAWCELYNDDVYHIGGNCDPNQQVTFYFSKGLATVSVTGVSLNKNSTTLTVGGTETLTATVSPDGATDKSVTWSSDNTSVATVDANGKVTAASAGTATITVTATNGTDDTSDDKQATCAVTVTAQAAPAETLLTTITPTGTTTYRESTEGVVNVTLSGISNYYDNMGWAFGGTVTVTQKEGYTITKCRFNARMGAVNDTEAPFSIDVGSARYVSSIAVYGYATGPDKSALNTAITAAETLYNSIKEVEDYSTIASTLSTAIDAAKEVADSDTADQDAVDVATTAITTAKTNAEAAKKDVDDTTEANKVSTLIEDLPAKEAITKDDSTKVDAAKAAYDALTGDQKKKVSDANKQKLNDAIAAIEKDKADTAAADAVIAKINALPATDAITSANKDAIKAARAAYDALTEDQKAKISDTVKNKLKAAETALVAAEQPVTVAAKADPSTTGTYYATFYDSTTSYTADCEVYYATANADGRLTLQKAEGNVIKAGEGVILKATSETVTLTKTTTEASYDSLLIGSNTETTVENALVLSLGKNGVWFYKYSGTLGANKAYLAQ